MGERATTAELRAHEAIDVRCAAGRVGSRRAAEPIAAHAAQPPLHTLHCPPHPPPQGLLDTLEGALGELQAGKLAAHETFFRGVETHEAVLHAACTQLGEWRGSRTLAGDVSVPIRSSPLGRAHESVHAGTHPHSNL